MDQDLPSLDSPAPRPIEEEGAPTWMVTFGDMMSLLLTFFILLYSMSELRVEKFVLASQSLREAMGTAGERTAGDPVELPPPAPEAELVPPDATSPGSPESGSDDILEMFTEAYMRMLAARLETLTEEQGLDERTVEIVTLDDGVYLRIRDAVLFESGDAALKSDGRTVIESLSEVTMSLEIPTVVAGHADDRPIATDRYPSNWELSAARAAGVARHLVSSGQDPEAIQVQSFGEHRPLADNATADGRARNRRVELFFSREEIRRAAARLLRSGAGLEETELEARDGSF